MFSMLIGYTVTEYIRNRRITLAIMELMDPKDKVIDIAYNMVMKVQNHLLRLSEKSIILALLKWGNLVYH